MLNLESENGYFLIYVKMGLGDRRQTLILLRALLYRERFGIEYSHLQTASVNMGLGDKRFDDSLPFTGREN